MSVQAPIVDTKPKRVTAKRSVLFLKDKGGTGQSTIASVLAEMHQRKRTGAYLIDGDGTTATLSRHFSDVPREDPADPSRTNLDNPIHTFSLHGTERDRDGIANVLAVDAPHLILDLPATSLTMIRRIDSDYGWIDLLADNGWRPTIVAAITPFEETVFDLRDAMEMFGKRADYVAVVNLGLAEERADFALWDESNTRAKFLAAGGIEVQFPKLKPRIAAKIQQLHITFEVGKTTPELGVADRSRLAKWLADAEASLTLAADRLGL